MGNNIGSGALVLTTDNQMGKGFKQAEKQLSGSLNKMKSDADKSKGFFSNLTEGFTIGAGAGAGLALLKPLVGEIAAGISTWATGTDDFAKRLAKMQEIAEDLARMLDRRLKNDAEWIDAAVDPKDRLKLVQAEIKKNEKELSGLIKTQDQWAEKSREFSTIWNKSTESLQLWMVGKRDEKKQEVDVFLKEATETIKTRKKMLEELREKNNRLLNPANNPALVGEINHLADDWQSQIDALTKNLSPLQAEIAKLEKKGASSAMLKNLREVGDKLELAQYKPEPMAAITRNSEADFKIRAERELQLLFPKNQGVKVEEKQLDELKKVNEGVLGMIEAVKNIAFGFGAM